MLAAASRSVAARVLCLALLASGCEGACERTHEATGRVAERVIPVEVEQLLGDRMAAQLEQELPLHPDPAVQQYVEGIAQELLAHAPRVPEGTTLRVRVIDAPDVVNAMALPGGHIYVYSGLIQTAADESELIGVLAHEVAHVTERHVVSSLAVQLGAQLLLTLARGEESGAMEQLVAELAAGGATGAFSRTAEREADALAVGMIAGAGWDPTGYVRFFEKLAQRQGREGLLSRFVASHPHPEERAEQARAAIEALGDVPARPSSPRFRAVVDRL